MSPRKKATAEPEPPPFPATVLAATEAQLRRDGHVQPALAASARMLAKAVDEADSASQRATAARELRMTMAVLAGMDSEHVRPAAEGDPAPAGSQVDEVRRAREQREKAGAVPALPSRNRRRTRA